MERAPAHGIDTRAITVGQLRASARVGAADGTGRRLATLPAVRVVEVDAVVVGAGAMGAATAWHLARRGRQVVVLEQFEAAHDRGSSHGSGRVFRIAYRDPRYVGLAARALPLWRELEADAGEVLLEQVGQLDHGERHAVEEIEANLRTAGWRAERLTPAAAHERYAGMRFEDAVVVSPDGGRCRADATVAALQRRAVAHGAELHVRTPVERIEAGPGGASPTATVHTARGAWRAPAVVVAAGAWTSGLLRGALGGPLGGLPDGAAGLPSLRVTLEQPAHFRPLLPGADWPSFLHHAPARGPEHPLGVGAYGVFSPGEGMKVGEHGTGPEIDPDRSPRAVDPALLTRLGRYVATWLPGLDPEPASVTTCLYTTTPDQHFVLDRCGPIVICSSCSGHGFKFVPAIGEIVADLADGIPQPEAAWRRST